ncbi:MAG: 4Fe-4S binding protein [Candidatus Omnitrophica bacterium]|nr:4Fe-4S binding protein [Candidatus Omnitrophota bacterium]
MSVTIDNDKCTGCGNCIEACPVQAIEIKNRKAVVDQKCIDCENCIAQCPQEAIAL